MTVNRAAREFTLDDGTVCPITNLYDWEGDETEDPAAAVSAVGQLPDGRWATIDLREFEPELLH